MAYAAQQWLATAAFLAATLAVLAGPPARAAAPDPDTQTTTAPSGLPAVNGDQAAPDGSAAPDDSEAPADTGTDAPADVPMAIPQVEYDFSKLPPPVARLRQQIIDAATTGDPEKLRTIIDANGEPPQFGSSDSDDPVAQLKAQSGDDGGREILAILIMVLNAGYVHVDVGTPDEMYIWPYFARYPIDKLSPPQLVELFKLVFAGDYQSMLDEGQYNYFRCGISPDGRWRYFVTDD